MAKIIYYILLVPFFSLTALSQGQILKPSNYKTQDNTPNLSSPDVSLTKPDPGGQCWTLEQAKAKFGDSIYYYEVSKNASWFRGASTHSYGNDSRQTSQLSDALIDGNTATWVFDIDTSAGYIVYNYIFSNPTSATNCYYRLNKSGENNPLDSFRYNFRMNNNPDYGKSWTPSIMNGLWVPLTIVNLEKGKKSFSITLGADSLTGKSIIRADAIRILKSDINGPDLEFGRRLRSFDSVRVEENFSDVIIGRTIEREIKLYNPGNTELLINSISLKFNSVCFNVGSMTPIRIPPGGKDKISVMFHPISEGYFIDTVLLGSNDPLEPMAKLGVSGNGVNYFFILNASDPKNPEPHYNAPYDTLNNEFKPSYSEYPATDSNEWSSSGSISIASFPFIDGNKRSRVNTSDSCDVWCEYKFYLEPGKEGDYIIEYSGPYYSSSSLMMCSCVVKTPSIKDSISVLFSEELVGDNWNKIGTSWKLNSGGPTTVRFYKYRDPLTGKGGYLRADLLRIRKVSSGTSYLHLSENPDCYSLSQNYPNPFNPATKIQFSIVDFGKVVVKVYDLLGREIRTIINENLKPGNYLLEWDGKNNAGYNVSSGTYFYRFITNKYVKTMKMMMIK
jgi:hypothetical protein